MTFNEFCTAKRALNTKEIKVDIEIRPTVYNQGFYIIETKEYGTFCTPLPAHREGDDYYKLALNYLSKLVQEIELYYNGTDKFDFIENFNRQFVEAYNCKTVAKKLNIKF